MWSSRLLLRPSSLIFASVVKWIHIILDFVIIVGGHCLKDNSFVDSYMRRAESEDRPVDKGGREGRGQQANFGKVLAKSKAN